jgi:hypothetical protein
MRKFCATGLVLVGWLLMLPPPVFPPVQDASGDYQVNAKAPLSGWITFKKFASEKDCNAALKTMANFYRCVSSDDPALKKTAAAAKTTNTK